MDAMDPGISVQHVEMVISDQWANEGKQSRMITISMRHAACAGEEGNTRACSPGSRELSKSDSDMASKIFTFTFTFTLSLVWRRTYSTRGAA